MATDIYALGIVEFHLLTSRYPVEGSGIDAVRATHVAGSRQSLLALRPDVPEALARVRAAGLRTAILSNGTPAMLDSAVAAARLAGCFDAVLSVEEVGAFKPDRRVYQLAVDRLGIPAAAIAFVSSNGWDAHAASAFGMQVVWCNRTGQPRERLPGKPDREITTLTDLPALVRA